MSRTSPTLRLLAGLVVTLLAVGVYSGYTIVQLRSLRELQTQTIDRNRTDTLLLLRIQNGLNSVALTMRDMLDSPGPYPLSAWQPQFQRLQADLDDALAREQKFSLADRTPGQRRYLADSFRQFREALDRVFTLPEAEARMQIRLSLQARQAALSTAVARLLVQNNASEEAAGARTRQLYEGVERNVYVFLAGMMVVIVLTSLYLVNSTLRLFRQVDLLSERRSELARQLISMQENTFRAVSRELHDDFGQILTAIGVMLQRADKRPQDLLEVREIVQETLEKVRALSHALHPVILDEIGFEGALDYYLPGFERQHGITVAYEKRTPGRELDREVATHLYRIVQEALNNVAKHSGSKRAVVRLRFSAQSVALEIEDEGAGFSHNGQNGLGLVSMRERAELMNGKIEYLTGERGGALVRVTVGLPDSAGDVEGTNA